MRYAIRSLLKTPSFTATAMLTLALGIGANSAIFSVVNAVLLGPLPYRDAGQLAFLWSASPSGAPQPLPPGRFVDFREHMTSFEALAGICQFGVTLTGGGAPEVIDAASVSSNFFDVLGARPLLGEPFRTGAAGARDVVLAFGLWTRRFGGNRAIVGSEIVVNGRARRVVAVMDRDFGWPAITARPSTLPGPELWIPGAVRDVPRTPVDSETEDLSANRTMGILRAVGRLRAGVSPEQARREADIIARRLATVYPNSDADRGAHIVPLRQQFFGPLTQPLLILAGAVAFVLAIACANVASLLLGRATARRREMAIRLALGASRRRVVRQFLTESLVLSGAGAIAGLVVCMPLSAWLARLNPGSVARLADAGVDARVLLFTAAVAILTGLAFGLVPALQAAADDPHEALKDGGSRGSPGPGAGRTRDLLVLGEIAVALVLLVAAGLLLRSFATLSRVDNGIDTRHLLTFSVTAPRDRATTPESRAAFHAELQRRVAALPGVVGLGAAVTLPIGGDDFSTTYVVEGSARPLPGQEPSAGLQVVTPGYFEAMRIRVVAGRDFTRADGAEAPAVVLVNETLAKQAWPGSDPIGRRVRAGGDESWMTVVGIVSDVRHRGPATPPRPELFRPLEQRPFATMAFVVRTAGEPAALTAPVRAAAAALDPMLPISKVATMDEHVERALSRPRFMSLLVGAFGVLALTLALVGIYGVMSYSVTERTRELAIRSALGAQRGHVLRLVLGKALALTGAGVALGTGAALALTQVLSGLLFGVTATDVPTFAASAAAIVTVAVAAALVPAARATRIAGAQLLR